MTTALTALSQSSGPSDVLIIHKFWAHFEGNIFTTPSYASRHWMCHWMAEWLLSSGLVAVFMPQFLLNWSRKYPCGLAWSLEPSLPPSPAQACCVVLTAMVECPPRLPRNFPSFLHLMNSGSKGRLFVLVFRFLTPFVLDMLEWLVLTYPVIIVFPFWIQSDKIENNLMSIRHPTLLLEAYHSESPSFIWCTLYPRRFSVPAGSTPLACLFTHSVLKPAQIQTKHMLVFSSFCYSK